ncbi:iron-sulfur cluster assembly accessory protein [Microbacterium sp. B2969]|uniref:Iron-sulfur cluster assembly accessory protein n=1 Tax=Microbacterium alkaliflavum TaxID=3248839 RepID=A0ABW7Q5V7_9MICO
MMLTLTDNAATVIADYVKGSKRRRAGIRIRPDASRSSGMLVELAMKPSPGDAIVEKNGARVFLDRGVAPYLASKEIDAEIASGAVNLFVREKDE